MILRNVLHHGRMSESSTVNGKFKYSRRLWRTFGMTEQVMCLATESFLQAAKCSNLNVLQVCGR